MRFLIVPRPLGTGASAGGLEREHHDRRASRYELVGGRRVIVVVHADSANSPVTAVEKKPGRWVAAALEQVGHCPTVTVQGLADYFDGVFVELGTSPLRKASETI